MARDPLYYDTIADDFESWMDDFDLATRLRWFEAQFARYGADNALVLDVGSGLGHFSRMVEKSGGRPVSLDIAGELLRRTDSNHRLRASAVELPLASDSLPVVVSSECIEHTPDPLAAIGEMLRVLEPGGRLILSCPNRTWRWSVGIANALGLRNFSGVENWPRRSEVRRAIEQCGATVVVDEGLYLLPFQLKPLRPMIGWINHNGQALRGLMINQCWVASK